MRLFHIHILCLALFISSTALSAQDIPVFGKSSEIITGTLANGVDYYMVHNDGEKGFADMALVQKGVWDVAAARNSLASLPHFNVRKPYVFLNDNGIKYGPDGYVKYLDNATVFEFSGVPAGNVAVCDSTLLLVSEIMATSPFRQTLIICGDVNPDFIRERLTALSLLVTARKELPAEEDAYEWKPDSSRVFSVTHSQGSGKLARIYIRYKAPRLQEDKVGSAQYFVARNFSRELESVLSRRTALAFERAGIPLADFRFIYAGSASRNGDEYLQIRICTSADAIEKAAECIAGVLSELDRNGVEEDELLFCRNMLNLKMKTGLETGRQRNSHYVEKCLNACLYGASLASDRSIYEFFLKHSLDISRERKFLNGYISSLLDKENNLVVSYDSPSADYSGSRLDAAFERGWHKGAPSDIHDFSRYDAIAANMPPGKVKLVSEAAEPVTGGTLWTFSNGIKVIFKKMPVKGDLCYQLVLRGGRSRLSELSAGESAWFDDLLRQCRVAGLKYPDFEALAASHEISIKVRSDNSAVSASGTVPKDKLRQLLAAFKALASVSAPDESEYGYFVECAKLRDDIVRRSSYGIDAFLDSLARPGRIHSIYKKGANLKPGTAASAAAWFSSQFSKLNDGVLFIAGDADAVAIKEILCSCLGSMPVDPKFRSRPVTVEPALVNSSLSACFDAGASPVGNGVPGFRMALRVRIPYTRENYAAFEIACMVFEKMLSAEMSSDGQCIETEHGFDLFPEECVYLNCDIRPCNAYGLPSCVEPVTPERVSEAVSAIIAYLPSAEVDGADLAAFKLKLKGRFADSLSSAEELMRYAELRYADGKDAVTDYNSILDGITADKVKSVLSMFRDSCRAVYVAK